MMNRSGSEVQILQTYSYGVRLLRVFSRLLKKSDWKDGFPAAMR